MNKPIREPAIQMISPKGIFKWPALNDPKPTYDKKNKEYVVQLVLQEDDDATRAFIQQLDPYYEAAIQRAQAAFDAMPLPNRKKLGNIKPYPLYSEVFDKE